MQDRDDINGVVPNTMNNDVRNSRHRQQARSGHNTGASGQRQDIQPADRMFNSPDHSFRGGWIEFSYVPMYLPDVIERPLLITDDHFVRRAYRSRTSSLVA